MAFVSSLSWVSYAWPLAVLLLLAGSGRAQTRPAAPIDPELTLKKAIQLHQAGDVAHAIPLYREYLKVRPDSTPALSNLGAALSHEGQYAEAIADYTKALKLQPGNPQTLANLGIAYYKTGDFTAARDQLQTALAGMLGNQQIIFLIADCDMHLGEPAKAVAALEPLETRLANDDTFNYLFGSALIANHENDRGSPYIDRILRRGDSAEARLLMGTLKLDLRDYPAAIAELKKSVELNPKLPEAHAWLGTAEASIGDAENAEAAFRAELAIDPNSFPATYYLGATAVTRQDAATARKLFARCLILRPNDASVRFQLATLDLAQNQVEKARGELEALVKEVPEFTAAHVTLATVYYRLNRRLDGDHERAIVRDLNEKAQAAAPGVIQSAAPGVVPASPKN